MTMPGIGSVARHREGRRDFVLARQAEVEQLHVAVGPHHDVVGLDVAMDDPGDVRDRQRLGDLARDVDRAVDPDPLRRQRPQRRRRRSSSMAR